jgi:uncharacterized protein YvpB
MTTGNARKEPTTAGRVARHGRRIALITLVTASAFVASGWLAYAMPYQKPAVASGENVRTPRASLTATGTPAPATAVPATPSADPAITTPVPTIAPTVVPTIAPRPTPVPTVAPTPQPPQTTFTIGVPVIQQTMVLDCETAALQMGLATYGYYYSQDALFARENPDLRAPVMDTANHRVLQWGDPYTNFVGQVNGSDRIPTGYGVYYPVILRMAREIGLTNAYGGEGLAPSTIYGALKTGHAVEVWIETNWSRPGVYSWTAFDGRTVRYSFAEHAVTLSGVSPTQVRVNDPLHGTQYWISKSTFETSWADFNNMAVVF